MRRERLIEMPASFVVGVPTMRMGALGVRPMSSSDGTRPAGRRIVPPVTATLSSSAWNQAGFFANV